MPACVGCAHRSEACPAPAGFVVLRHRGRNWCEDLLSHGLGHTSHQGGGQIKYFHARSVGLRYLKSSDRDVMEAILLVTPPWSVLFSSSGKHLQRNGLPWASPEATVLQCYRRGAGFRPPGAALAPAPTNQGATRPLHSSASSAVEERWLGREHLPAPHSPPPPRSCGDSVR